MRACTKILLTTIAIAVTFFSIGLQAWFFQQGLIENGSRLAALCSVRQSLGTILVRQEQLFFRYSAAAANASSIMALDGLPLPPDLDTILGPAGQGGDSLGFRVQLQSLYDPFSLALREMKGFVHGTDISPESQLASAREHLTVKARAALEGLRDGIMKISDQLRQEELLLEADLAEKNARRGMTVFLVCIGLALSILTGVFLRYFMVWPLVDLSDTFKCLAAGEMTAPPKYPLQGELKDLQTSAGDLLSIISRLKLSMEGMHELLSKGATDQKIVPDAFKGIFAELVERMNVITREFNYSIGCFLDALEGHRNGTFQPIEVYLTGGFGKLQEKLNLTFREQEQMAGEIQAIVDAMVDCQFNVQLQGNFTGTFVKVKNSMNSMIKNVGSVVQSIKDLSGVISQSSQEALRLSVDLRKGSELVKEHASATEELSTTFNSMASSSEEISLNISNILTTAEEMSRNMKSVAGSIQEVSKSVNRISESSRDASSIAGKAMEMANEATGTMNALGGAAQEIGKVTEVIKRIAEQTNLLALNATIEAASAGEAGKGFAVVAHEIKELANQSAQAAEGIATKIGGVQTNSQEAIKNISEISTIIKRIFDSVEKISESVARQTQSANDISLNASEAAKGTEHITISIAEISKGAGDVSQSIGFSAKSVNRLSDNIKTVLSQNDSLVTKISEAADRLNGLAADLNTLMGKFKA